MDGFQSKLPPGILPHGLPQVKEVQPAITALEQEKAKQEVKEGMYFIKIIKLSLAIICVVK